MKAPQTFLALRGRNFCVLIFSFLSLLTRTGVLAADAPVSTQDPGYVIVNWGVQDGLPSSRINAVLQTRDGYIWLATHDGLARFDGVRFERFYENDLAGISTGLITCLFEDSQGCLWFGTQSGEIGWKDASGFHTFAAPQGRLLERVDFLAESSDGTIWASSLQSLLPVKNLVPGIHASEGGVFL